MWVSLPGVSGRSVALTTHFLLAPGSRMCRAIVHLPSVPTWQVTGHLYLYFGKIVLRSLCNCLDSTLHFWR